MIIAPNIELVASIVYWINGVVMYAEITNILVEGCKMSPNNVPHRFWFYVTLYKCSSF